MWLLQDNPPPSHSTIGNFMNNVLNRKIDEIFADINSYIFTMGNVDLNHVYIDGTKIEANANKYSWVWKKSCEKNRLKVFARITELLGEMNEKISSFCVKFGIREEYAIEYLEQIQQQYVKLCGFDPETAIRGRGHHKTIEQRHYDKLSEYISRLKKYAEHIKICGDERNSYSKTDHDATFMRMKKDYMGNDQLLPGYNIQLGVCDEYIAVFDVKQYASDMECFKPLIEKFNQIYEKYPEYPVADAGYGSFNNYLYCEELTKFHKEVLCNLNSIHGALLRMNRSIQSEGANGIIKWNRSYTRARRRGSKALNLEIAMICCGFNLHKFHLKKSAIKKAA